MADTSAQFDGSIPELYDKHLGPLFFEYYAADLSRRVSVPDGGRVLEIACGTGISTLALRKRFSQSIEIVATDLNDPMMDFARKKFETSANVTFQQADAQDLPFGDGEFDAVATQFSIMFYPDKAAGMREAARVLKPGGMYVFNVWDALELNPIARLTHETIASFFEKDPPGFMRVPFGFYALDPIKELLADAGFQKLEIGVLPSLVESSNAQDLATGLVKGNPAIHEVREGASVPPEVIIDTLAQKIEAEFGSSPSKIPMQAIVFSARR